MIIEVFNKNCLWFNYIYIKIVKNSFSCPINDAKYFPYFTSSHTLNIDYTASNKACFNHQIIFEIIFFIRKYL